MSQVLTAQATTELTAWVRLLRAHAALTRTFSAELLSEHGLTINDYEALLLLSRAGGQRMRRVDLAQSLVLTASGVTRLLDGLQACGLVEKATCESDARVTYAVLTDLGRERLREASRSHVASIRALFGERYTDDELRSLSQLLARLPGAENVGGDECEPEPAQAAGGGPS